MFHIIITQSARRTAHYGKTRLPKLVMPSFPYEDDPSGLCERSEAKAATLQVEAITAEP